jgi:hypothetical protein
MSDINEQRRRAAASAFKDILGGMRNEPESSPPPPKLTSKRLAVLLLKNFKTLDPDNNGITREEIATAMLKKDHFSGEEFLMLQIIARYFDTIANMSDDEEGKETVITKTDMKVLNQFLLYSELDIEQLHEWREQDIADENKKADQ